VYGREGVGGGWGRVLNLCGRVLAVIGRCGRDVGVRGTCTGAW